MAKLPGKRGGLYLNEGDHDTPVLTKIPGVRGLKQAADWDMFDAMDRDSDAKTFLNSQIDLIIEFDFIFDPANALHMTLRNDAIQAIPHEFYCLAGPAVTGTVGFRGEYLMSGFPMEFDLSGPTKVGLKLHPYAGWTNPHEAIVIP